MSTDTRQEFEVLSARLDEIDRRSRRQRVAMIAVAAAAIVVVGAVIAGALRGPQTAPPIQEPEPGFTSSVFAVPFTADLPPWTDSLSTPTSPTSEQAEWVTWNRCPDNEVECIGMSFNRYSAVDLPAGRTDVTTETYLAYLEQLAQDGRIRITDRATTTVGGRLATVLSITGVDELPYGLGCHSDGSCDQFFASVPGVYAVVDTAGLDPDGDVLVLWTRAGAVSPALSSWREDFDRTLASIRFGTPRG